MSYTALYRKFRPASFEDVKGQDHIVKTLTNQIKAGRIGHAYLFCGTRGTGKTSAAKIFAKAVNCDNPIDGSPCGECEGCRNINKTLPLNIIEIDAASNNGVDNVRDIIDQIDTVPLNGKYSTYIIDEAHMLSAGAFNALLKTLEEPPEHVIFILATTEPQKIPVTIMSRCQRYDFHRISIETISERLLDLCSREEIDIEEKAVNYIAKTADGSMRDALSLLDQCIAYYLGEKITYDKVLKALGSVDNEIYSRLLRAVIDQNLLEAFSILDDVMVQGRDLTQFVNDFVYYLRNLMLIKTLRDGAEDVIDASSERIEALREESGMIDMPVIMRYIGVMSELSTQLRFSSQKRVLVEIALIKLVSPAMEGDVTSIENRVSILEKKMDSGDFIKKNHNKGNNDRVREKHIEKKPQETDIPLERAMTEDVKYVVSHWRQLMSTLSGGQRACLEKGVPTLAEGNVLKIVFDEESSFSYNVSSRRDDDGGRKRLIGTEDNPKPEKLDDVLNEAIKKYIKKDVKVVLCYSEDGGNRQSVFDIIGQKTNMEIKEEDF